jgi:hypothetical protein
MGINHLTVGHLKPRSTCTKLIAYLNALFILRVHGYRKIIVSPLFLKIFN